MRSESKILIADNKKIAPGYFLMRLQSPGIAQNSLPGQFLHIKCSTSNNPLLRRPLSIHHVIGKDIVEISYKVVGKGTHWLSQRKKGEKIDCLGPLGNGFQLSVTSYPQKIGDFRGLNPWNFPEIPEGQLPVTNIIVAGGIGIAPLFFLAEKIRKSPLISSKSEHGDKSSSYIFGEKKEGQSEIAVFIGAKTKDEILCAKELKNLGAEIHIATEDGSLGSKGLVSDLLNKKLITEHLPLTTIIYACGPKAMLKEIALISKKHQIPCQVSFEQFMGCGIGICNSCVIRTKQGYRRVCKDGPVFRAEEIDWEKI